MFTDQFVVRSGSVQLTTGNFVGGIDYSFFKQKLSNSKLLRCGGKI